MFRMLGNILIGVLIGLTIVVGLFFYPGYLDRFKPSVKAAKNVTEKAGDILWENVESLRPHIEEAAESVGGSVDKSGGNETKSRDGKKATGLAEERKGESAENFQDSQATVETIDSSGAEERELTVFLTFDNKRTAEEFVASIKKSTEIDLELGNKGYRYVVFIPADSEAERIQKEDLIRTKAGLKGK